MGDISKTVPGSETQPADAPLGQEAVRLGLISNAQLQEVLLHLRNSVTKGAKPVPNLGDTLVSKGLISIQQLGALRQKPEEIPVSFGKYQIVRELGRGGMGVVYEAKDGDLGRRVALKMLLGPRSSDTRENKLEEETRFIREARVTATLPKHPNIVGIYETGILEGHRYIAMEFIEGRQLSDWRKHQTAPLRHQVAVLRDAALAVDHAHRHGIIHRDLKPANILVDAQNRPHVTDFGLAKSGNPETANSLTAAGMVMGTPAYMSPEQAQGRKGVDRRTDVWSLGVMLYELLTGRQPFRGETPLDTVLKTVNDPVVPPSAARGGLSPSFDRGIENICLKALAKSPNDRYRSAKALADDLTHWIKGETITVEPPKQDRSKSYTLIALAVGAIGVVAAAWVMFYPSAPSPVEVAAARELRSQNLVTQGQRLLAQGKNADALVSFGRALAENPSNRLAEAGKREAEQRLVAVAADAAKRTSPKESGPAVPAPPRVSPDEEAARKARDAQEAESRRVAAISKELADLDQAVNAMRDAETFGPARDFLEQASKRHPDQEWGGSIEERQTTLKNAVEALFASLKEQAIDARRHGNSAGLEAVRERVLRWKWPGLPEALNDAVAKADVPGAPAVRPSSELPAPPAGMELAPIKGHRNGVCSASFSPDGRLVLTASFDNTVRLWDVPARKERSVLLDGVGVLSVAYSPDGRWMAAGMPDGKIKVWDSAKLGERSFPGHDNRVTAVAFSPDSTLLASSSPDNSARVWDVATGTLKLKFEGHPRGAMSLAFFPDGKSLAVGSADSVVKIWRLAGDRPVRTLEGGHEGVIFAVAVSPDGRVLASGGTDSKVVLWDLDSGRRRALDGHHGVLKGLAFGPSGHCLASACLDTTLRVWDVDSGAVKMAFTDENSFYGVTWSRKGDLLAGCSGSAQLRIWDDQVLESSRLLAPGK